MHVQAEKQVLTRRHVDVCNQHCTSKPHLDPGSLFEVQAGRNLVSTTTLLSTNPFEPSTIQGLEVYIRCICVSSCGRRLAAPIYPGKDADERRKRVLVKHCGAKQCMLDLW
jgi:hypothetical protein